MKLRTILTFGAIAIVVILISLWVAQQSYTWFPPQATQESKFIDNLFALFVFLGSIIFLGVTGTITYTVLTQKVSRFDMSDGPAIEGNVTLEVVWTVIPILLVLSLASFSYWTYEQMSIRGPMEIVHLHLHDIDAAYAETLANEPVETIEVNAKQWSWTFHYPEQDVISDELHLPVNHRVRLAMHSDDVIHGFFVPAFRIKQDILPNRSVDLEFTPVREGTYHLNDSQFSGTYFAINQANVVVESPDQYAQWLAETKTYAIAQASNPPYEEYTAKTKKVFKTGWATVVPAPPPMVNRS